MRIRVPKDAVVKSVYTGKVVGIGEQIKGIPNDAPVDDPHYGGKFHGMQYDPEKEEYALHRMI